jgi:Spy/CpxP family protein refolding chaperone
MKKQFFGLLLAGLITISLAPQMASAQPPDNQQPGMGMHQKHSGMGGPHKMKPGTHKHHGGMIGMLQKLNLTEEQKNQLKAKKEASKTQMEGIRNQLKTERQKLMEQMFDPDVSKAQLLNQQDKVSNLQNQIHRIRIEGIADLKATLTPEQKAILKQEAAQHQQKMQQRMQLFQEKRQQHYHKKQQASPDNMYNQSHK